MRAPTTIPALRVAIVAGHDGEPRVVALRPGTEAPHGAVAAMLVAMTREDGEAVLRMLGETP